MRDCSMFQLSRTRPSGPPMPARVHTRGGAAWIYRSTLLPGEEGDLDVFRSGSATALGFGLVLTLGW